MTQAIIIRHGQTAWNEGRGERFRGRAEIDLDELGVKQAEATARRLARWKVEAVYSSPLFRAVRTAQILAKKFNLQPQIASGLIDIDYGEWQGLSLKEAEAQDNKLYSRWLYSPHLVTFPRGESLEQVQKRVVAQLNSLLLRHPEQTILLVSHKVVCKVLILSLLGLGLPHFWQVEQDTCAINLVEKRGNNIVVKLLNDTCHLKNLR